MIGILLCSEKQEVVYATSSGADIVDGFSRLELYSFDGIRGPISHTDISQQACFTSALGSGLGWITYNIKPAVVATVRILSSNAAGEKPCIEIMLVQPHILYVRVESVFLK